MTPRRVSEASLRPDRLELSRLGWALALSILIHVLCYGGYELGLKFNVWNSLRLPVWLEKTMALINPPIKPERPAQEQEMPLVFVDVNPQVATPDAPPNAKYYSDKNSRAANPEADKDTNVPKITGKQTEIVKANDVPRSKFDKLQPSIAKADQDQAEERAKPKSPEPGDLAMARPDVNLRPGTGTADQPKPRTIKEALMRQNRNQLAGEKMKQDGGTSRFHLEASFDTKATSTGVYDAAFIEAVEQRWFDLLDNMSYDGYRHGRVVLEFHLNYDGRITDMSVVENTVTETLGLLCEKAVLDPAPFDKWPREMRLTIDKDYRDIQFAFYYN